MTAIRIYANKRNNKVMIVIGAVVMLAALILLASGKIFLEPLLTFCVGATVLIYSLYKLKDFRAQLKIAEHGIADSSWRGYAVLWDHISDVDFHTIGRNVQTIRLHTQDGKKFIYYLGLEIRPEELMEIILRMIALPADEREGFLEYVIEKRRARGVRS